MREARIRHLPVINREPADRPRHQRDLLDTPSGLEEPHEEERVARWRACRSPTSWRRI
jgi:hypothetical protein